MQRKRKGIGAGALSSALFQRHSRIEPLETRCLFSVPALTAASEDLGGAVVADAADPVRNVAYVYDQGSNHILAINTSTGTTTAVCTPAANVAGLAVSVDDTRLFASEPTAFQIEVFSLPAMTLEKTLDVGVEVSQIVAAANDRIVGDTGSMTGFNAETGATLFTLPEDYDGLIHANLAGTMLYDRSRGLSGNDGSINAYNMSGTGDPVSVTSIPGPTGANSTDFAVDTTAGHAYFGDGGGDGVEVTLLSNGNQTNWDFDGGGSVNGLATFPGDNMVFASTFNNVIGEFNESGTEEAAWTAPSGINGQTMVITPNDNVLSIYGTGINLTGVSSLDVTQTPALTTSTTTLAVSLPGISFGSSITLSAAVASTGSGTPTGSVNFLANGSSVGSATLGASGVATLTTSDLPVGTDGIVASYSGDTAFQGSESAAETVTVSQTSSITQLTGISPSSAAFGAAVTFTGKVSAASGTGIPTGTIDLFSGSTQVGTGTLASDGTFSIQSTTLPIGTDNITAQYSGDDSFTTSTSTVSTVTISGTALASVTSITSIQPNPEVVGSAVTISGTVAPATTGSLVPTGTVTFADAQGTVGAVAVAADGSFAYSTAALPVGDDSITASYSGDGYFAASVSAAQSVTITAATTPTGPPAPAETVTTISSLSPNPASPSIQVAIDGTVAAATAGGATPTGTVTLYDGTTSIGTAAVQSDGSFTFPINGLPVGSDSITASYGGDTNYAASTSTAQTETIAASVAYGAFGKVTIPASVIAGVKFTSSIPVTATNYGAKSTGLFTVNLYVNQAATLDGNQTQVGTARASLPLLNQRGHAFHFSVRSVPPTLTSGTYNLISEVVGPNNVATTVRFANTVQVVAPFVSLAAAVGSVAPASIHLGKTGAVFVTITNNGNVDAVGRLSLALTATDGSGPVLATLSPVPPIRIAAGKSRKIRVSFKTTELTAGSYVPYVSVSLDGQSATATGAAAFTVD